MEKTGGESQRPAETETEAELLGQSGDESESFSQPLSAPWEPKAWPEGRQVLTHLVEGFVIQEGLQPFPVRKNTHKHRAAHRKTFILTAGRQNTTVPKLLKIYSSYVTVSTSALL